MTMTKSSFGRTSIGPTENKTSVWTAYCSYGRERSPNRKRKRNLSNSASPIEMIIIAVSPVPRFRRGLHRPMSSAAEPIPPTANAMIAAGIRLIPRMALKKYATNAPNTICSDSAKLTRPVVP